MTTIKITELSDIGANLATSTVVPVVNMAGTPTTQKTNIGNIANIILEGAGVDYPEASVALLAQTVSNAAQPNITSVGTLTNVVVSGNASINGNITSNGTAYLGNISTTGLASITTLNVGTTANLGSVNNVIIEGGTDGQVLTTDGDGNLSWTSGATSYGNSNVVTLLSVFGSNTITTTGNVSVGNIVATGISSVANFAIVTDNANTDQTWTFGANGRTVFPSGMTIEGVTTPVTATALIDANGISIATNFGNAVQIEPSNITVVANLLAWHFTGDGNLTLPNTANVSINYANGSPYGGGGGGSYGDSNVVSLMAAFGSNTITTTGNISGGNLVTGGEVVASGNVSSGTGLSTGGFLSVDGTADLHDTTVTGNLSATGNITANNLGNISAINLTGSNSNVLYGNGVFAAVAGGSYGNSDVANYLPTFTGNLNGNSLTVQQDVSGNGALRLQGIANGNSTINIGGEADIDVVANVGNINLYTSNNQPWIFDQDGNLTLPGNTFAVNYANGTQVSIGGGGNGTPGGSNTQIQFNDSGNFGANSGFTFDSTTGNISIPGTIISGNTITIDNRASGNSADINLYSADDILIQARDRDIGSTSEGGDINIFAGDSAEDSDNSAGDIVIEAGAGGASNLDFGGSGGFVRIEAGAGGNAVGANYSAQSGGSLTLRAGDAGDNNGNIDLGGSGGDVTINAGDSTGNGDPGGSIILRSGDAGANALAGQIQLIIPGGVFAAGGTWTFDGEGIIQLPNSGTISNEGNNIDIGSTNAISLEASSAVNIYTDTGTNAWQWQFQDDGNLRLPTIELDVGNTINEQTVIQSQRKIIPGLRYSAEITGITPTVVYTATSIDTTSMKVTMQIQHIGLGFEFFDVSATSTGGNTYYTVSNRVQPPTIDNSTVVVDLNGSNIMEITVTINSGAANSWVTYDATEFGIAVD